MGITPETVEIAATFQIRDIKISRFLWIISRHVGRSPCTIAEIFCYDVIYYDSQVISNGLSVIKFYIFQVDFALINLHNLIVSLRHFDRQNLPSAFLLETESISFRTKISPSNLFSCFVVMRHRSWAL